MSLDKRIASSRRQWAKAARDAAIGDRSLARAELAAYLAQYVLLEADCVYFSALVADDETTTLADLVLAANRVI